MMEKFQQYQSKLIAARYGNPTKGMALIVVAGPFGKTTTITLLKGILEESGRKVALAAGSSHDESILGFYRHLAEIKKSRPDMVIIEVTEKLAQTGCLKGIAIDTVIALGDDEITKNLLGLNPKHVVVPSGMTIPEGSIEPYQQISFGENDQAEAKIDSIKLLKHGTELKMTIDHQTKLDVATYLVGRANAYCLTAAIAAAYVLGVEISAMQEGVADIESIAGNFERIDESALYVSFVDSAREHDSMLLAIDSAKSLAKRRLLVAFDHMPDEDLLHAAKLQADRIFVVSSESTTRSDIDTAQTAKGVSEKASRGAKQGDIVLLLGVSFLDHTNNISLDDEHAS